MPAHKDVVKRGSAEPLGRHAVHVWLFTVDEVADDAAAEVDDADRDRAADFAFEEDGRRFLAGRASLRHVCRRYVADAGERFRIAYEHGRPFVPGARLACSLSHAGELIAVAVSRRAVGIDVEQIRGIEPESALVARACTPAQLRELERLPPGERERVFLAQWVRKEAAGKALGVGLDLALAPSPFMAFPRAGRRRHRGLWRVFELETPDGYVGAVAGRGLTRLVVRRSA